MNWVNLAHASETAAEDAAGAETGILSSLGIDLSLFVFQLINFAVVALILWFLILKPLTKKMAERQKMIDKSIDQTKAIEKNLAQSEEQFQAKILQAKKEANKIIALSREEAVKTTQVVKDQAQQEIEKVKDQAQKQILKEKEIARQEIRNEAANLIAAAAEKFLAAKIDISNDDNLITQTISDLKKKS